MDVPQAANYVFVRYMRKRIASVTGIVRNEVIYYICIGVGRAAQSTRVHHQIGISIKK
jgi:hypothetical protein